ncbi:MAG TPA: RNHCP domain-containing protein [Rhizomicrobium sp.]|jgi:DNA-directed RNA polymerase subunit RPC12/RpoP|nr:RNHCP domain-containing protein [Rhizomicrobium sp.]
MARQDENRGFICISCGAAVEPLTNGSYRNHCPVCLSSVHVDLRPGDRASGCGGLMRPVGLAHHGRKGWQIVHVCMRCGARQPNRVAEGTIQPDDPLTVARLSGGGLEPVRKPIISRVR